MNIIDWYQLPSEEKHKRFSVNGVPYPHDDWLALTGKPTTWQIAELVKRWGEVLK